MKTELFVFSNDRRYDSGNLKLSLRFDRFIFWIGRNEGDIRSPLPQILHRPLPIDFGNNNISAFRRLPFIYNDHVAGQYAGP